MAAPSKVIQLVKKFEVGYSNYLSHHYNEENLKIEFLNPFFESLGWDLRNEAGFSNQYKDVEFEQSLKIGRTTKSPDYAFKIGGTNKFFVEAKKPSENIESNPKYAFQLKHYAWNAKLPLSILTDFEEFAVYNTRLKPSLNDKSNIGRVLYFKYTDYINKWDEIASIFSKDAVWKGAFDKYAENDKLKKGTTEVDDEFLKEIESWREMLAKNIAIRNPGLSNRSLNEAVQNTIDRIIFLRICEDKAIEPERQLQILLNGNNVYPRMIQIFRDADEKYNSGLFHFQKEPNRDNYDSISLVSVKK